MNPAASRAVLLIGAMVALAAVWTVPAQAKLTDTGAWSRAPDLLEGHVGHTATLLPDGRVLVAGGTDVRGVAIASCELFEPKTNRWIRAASMGTARAGHTATLLANGDVLVIGGATGLDIFPVESLASAEIYHPGSDSWISVALMHVARSMHTATLLRGGRVLVVGGTFDTSDSEIYEPTRNTWSLISGGVDSGTGHTATLLPDGRVLVVGGWQMVFASAAIELFNPQTDQWATAAEMVTGRYEHTATLLPDGRVLILGGFSSQRVLVGGVYSPYPSENLTTEVELYDPRRSLWSSGARMTIARLEHTATLLRSGAVLVVGSAYASNADSQLYDVTINDWLSTGMRMDRYLHTATLLQDGRVLIAGGYGIGSSNSAWIFSPVTTLSAPSLALDPGQRVAALLVLVLLVGLGFAATAGRLLPRRAAWRGGGDSDWIDP